MNLNGIQRLLIDHLMKDFEKEKVIWYCSNIFFAKHFTGYFAYDIKVKSHNSISYYSQFMSIEIEIQRGKILAQNIIAYT